MAKVLRSWRKYPSPPLVYLSVFDVALRRSILSALLTAAATLMAHKISDYVHTSKSDKSKITIRDRRWHFPAWPTAKIFFAVKRDTDTFNFHAYISLRAHVRARTYTQTYNTGFKQTLNQTSRRMEVNDVMCQYVMYQRANWRGWWRYEGLIRWQLNIRVLRRFVRVITICNHFAWNRWEKNIFDGTPLCRATLHDPLRSRPLYLMLIYRARDIAFRDNCWNNCEND